MERTASTRCVTLLLTLGLLLAAGCGGGGNGEGAGTAPGGNGEETSQGGRCANATDGYSVEYPAGWHTNPSEIAEPCTYFHPEPFDVPIGSEFLDVGVVLNRDFVSVDEASGEDPTRKILEREEFDLNGHRAVRLEAETTAGGLLDPGMRFYQVVVERAPDQVLIFSTFDFPDLDYERNKQVIDEMADSLELTG